MDKKQIVENSLLLLSLMKLSSDKTRAALEESGEREDTAARLRDLEEQAAGVETERELLEVADEVHRLVEGTPPLAEGLLTKEMDVEEERRIRWFSLEESEASREDLNIQEKAVQMLNEVRATRQEVERPPREGSF